MTLTEKWNSIVSDFQTNKSSKEEAVQKLWEEIFADAVVFGYSRRSGEIDIWRNIQVGSRERTIPDIIIRDSINDKDLFVVELKQHNLPFNKAYREQLFSYMRLLELKVGILICDKLYIYYRENNNTEYSLEISFVKNSMIGEKFIELFSKGCFNKDKIKDFLIKIEKTKSNVSLIKSDLRSLDLKKLLNEYFSEKYSIEEIELALKDLNISITDNFGSPVRPVRPVSPVPLGNPVSSQKNRCTKGEIINLLRNNGYEMENYTTTYASKNDTMDIYWANPSYSMLQRNWNLILNDNINRVVYIFRIPACSGLENRLIARADRTEKIDLQIYYNDFTFTDSRSKISFKPFYVGKVDY